MKWLAQQLRKLAELIGGPATPPAVPVRILGGRQATPTDVAWDKGLSEYLLTIGTKARATAAAWGTSATGLLAVLGAASILKGRETLDLLAEPGRTLVATLVFVALTFAFLTLYSAAAAAQGSPSAQLLWPDRYRSAQFRAAESAARWMAISRVLVIVAFLSAVAATALVLVGPAAEKSQTFTLVVGGPNGNESKCGKLEVKDKVLTIDGAAVPNPALGYYSVAACPK